MSSGIHLAFEAARMIEIEPSMGLSKGECFLDPDIDDKGNPYVLVRVEATNFKRIEGNLPNSVRVSGCDVPLIVKSMTMRMN